MRFFSSRTVMGCGVVEDGDRLRIAIFFVRDKVSPARHQEVVYVDGDVNTAMTIEIQHAPGYHCETEVRRVSV